jgi:hypothetical protein
MGRKRKAGQNIRKDPDVLSVTADYIKATKPLHPDVLPLAHLTALIDPEDVRQADLTNTLPKAFSTALHLLWKINDFYNGRINRICSLEQLEEAKLLRRHLIEREWPLLEGEQFSLKEATSQRWCNYKTVPNLKRFLKRNDYPVRHYFDGPPFITEAAYKKAREAELERIRQRDRERKKTRKRKIASGKSRQTSGTNRVISASPPEQNGILPEN